MRRLAVLCAGVTVVACLILLAPSSLTCAQTDTAGPLITAIHAERLLAEWGVPITGQPRFGPSSPPVVLEYPLGVREHGPGGYIGVGVSESSDKARYAFGRILGVPAVAPTGGGQDAAGDDFAYWVHVGGSVTSILLRRDNVVISGFWRGSADEALAFARRIDELLLTDREIAPRGEEVRLPTVEITVPDYGIAGKKNADLIVRVLEGEPVRMCHYAASRDQDNRQLGVFLRGLHSPFREAKASIELSKPGGYILELTFATEGNVIFRKTCHVQVIAESDLPVTVPRLWNIPGNTIYFVRSADEDWWAREHKDREWLEFYRGTFGPTDDKEKWLQQALDELTSLVRKQWLPPVYLLNVASDHMTDPPQIVYYSAFRVQDYGVIYMGVLGKQLFAYIEQPNPLPEGAMPLRAFAVLRDDLNVAGTDGQGETAHPRVEIAASSLQRYRAGKPEGPFKGADILLLNVGVPTEPDLHFPGYR